MKYISLIIASLLFISQLSHAQTTAVTKYKTGTTNSNDIVADLNIDTGRTLTITSGGTLALSGNSSQYVTGTGAFGIVQTGLDVTASTANTNFLIPFVTAASTNQTAYAKSTGFTFNPSTQTLVVNTIELSQGLGGDTHTTALGVNALNSTTTGDANTALGHNVLTACTNGNYNSGFGVSALEGATSGNQNTGVGTYSMQSLTTGENNTGVGTSALISVVSGSGNVAIGATAGYYETGSNTFYVDNQTRTDEATGQASSLLYGTFNATPASQTLAINAGAVSVGSATSQGVITAGHAVIVKVTGASYTVGTTDVRELYGGIIYVTSAATITVPAVAVGANFTVITIGAIAVSVDPNASDLIYLNGTALSDGDKITNASLAGDMAVFTYYDGTGWAAQTNSGWTDGN